MLWGRGESRICSRAASTFLTRLFHPHNRDGHLQPHFTEGKTEVLREIQVAPRHALAGSYHRIWEGDTGWATPGLSQTTERPCQALEGSACCTRCGLLSEASCWAAAPWTQAQCHLAVPRLLPFLPPCLEQPLLLPPCRGKELTRLCLLSSQLLVWPESPSLIKEPWSPDLLIILLAW